MLKLLKLGVTGPQVEQWQTFLRGQGFVLGATGTFDEATADATSDFQREHQLDVDGKAGNQTLGFAATLGFELVDPAANDAYPAKPAFAPLSGSDALQASFGPMAFVPAPTPDNPEGIRITNGWEAGNIVPVTIAQLVGVEGANAQGHVRFHKKGAKQLVGLWAAWELHGLLPLVLSYAGAYNPRFVRGKAQQQILSNHAFGTAFDINAAWNPLGAEPAPPGHKGCVYALVPLAHAFGFYWGGHFTRRDGMHFELARLLP